MNIDEILHKHFLNEDSKAELEILKSWKEESEENLAAFKEMKDHWKQFEQLKDYKQYNIEQAWNAVDEKIESKHKINQPAWPMLLKIAAALLVIFAALFLFKGDTNNKTSQLLASQESSLVETLDDNSIVTLNNQTTIDLSDFTTTNRKLSLIQGEAYFDVQSDKEYPFSIDMGKYSVRVLGTEFNLVKNENNITLNVLEGSVLFSNGSREIQVIAGEKLIADDVSFSKAKSSDLNAASWKTGELTFENTLLTEAIKDLSKFFKTEIKISPQSSQSGNCILNTSFKDENLQEMLDELKTVYGMEYQQSEKLIVITKTDC